MFTLSEMLALIELESSFGSYVCHRRPGGSTATSDLVTNNNNKKSRDSQKKIAPIKKLPPTLSTKTAWKTKLDFLWRFLLPSTCLITYFGQRFVNPDNREIQRSSDYEYEYVSVSRILTRYILFETRTGDEKDDNNSLQRFGVLHLLQRGIMEGSEADLTVS